MIRIQSSDDQRWDFCGSCQHRGTSECQACDEGDLYEFDPDTEELLAA